MKKRLLKIAMTVLAAMVMTISSAPSMFGQAEDEALNLWSSPGLEELATTIVKAYAETSPGITVNLISEGKMPDGQVLLKPGNYGIISESKLNMYVGTTSWKISIGREIYVPVMSTKNPLIQKILATGISPAEFAMLFASDSKPLWGDLALANNQKPVSCLYPENEAATHSISGFLGCKSSEIVAKGLVGSEQVLSYLSDDIYALGFCRLTDIAESSSFVKQEIALVPIDLNGNNEIDPFENIYSGTDMLERGVWIGKYPKSLYENIYLTAASAPVGDQDQAFVSWLISDGQPILYAEGYSELVNSERKSKLLAMSELKQPITPIHDKPMQAINIIYIGGILLAGLLLLLIVTRLFRGKREKTESLITGLTPAFSERSVHMPGGLFYDKSHTWAFMEKDGYVKTGLDDFLQHVTGKITRVKMKNTGEKISKGETFLKIIQDGKHLELKSPVSGTIMEVNSRLNQEPSLLNSSPYESGWVYSIQTTDWLKEIKGFLLGAKHSDWIKGEFQRLKDFLSVIVKPHAPGEVQVVMQEGGELKEGVLEHFGPEVWEEFQLYFFKSTK